jgi:hypothetical protein
MKRVLEIDRGDDNMNVLHTIELYTFKWLNYMLYELHLNKVVLCFKERLMSN